MNKFKEINKNLKTTDIKGKQYVEVNTRVSAYRDVYPEGDIQTQILSLENGIVVIKADIYNEEGKHLSSGIAYEKESSSFINKTSYIENCETSAIGRALGMLGIGIDTSIASAEEVTNAINNQENLEPKKIGKREVDILNKTIQKYNVSEETLEKILAKYNYTTLEDITMDNYAKIGNEMSK